MKPTTLGLVHFSELQSLIECMPQKGTCVKSGNANGCGRQHVSLQGTDEMGNFITAPFKQYPPGMNNAIALAAISSWERLGFTTTIDEDAFEHRAADFYVPLDFQHIKRRPKRCPWVVWASIFHVFEFSMSAKRKNEQTKWCPQVSMDRLQHMVCAIALCFV